MVIVGLAFGQWTGKTVALASVGSVDAWPTKFNAAQVADEPGVDLVAGVFVGHKADSQLVFAMFVDNTRFLVRVAAGHKEGFDFIMPTVFVLDVGFVGLHCRRQAEQCHANNEESVHGCMRFVFVVYNQSDYGAANIV